MTHGGSVGRIGALAFFLGVGSLTAWVPAAAADGDTSGPPSASADPGRSASAARPAGRPGSTPATRRTAGPASDVRLARGGNGNPAVTQTRRSAAVHGTLPAPPGLNAVAADLG